jgi:hypothetical protein
VSRRGSEADAEQGMQNRDGGGPVGTEGVEVGRLLPSTGGSGSRANGNGIKAAGTRLDIVGAHVVRRPPQHPSGEEDRLTCFRGSGRLVALRCAAKRAGDLARRLRALLHLRSGHARRSPVQRPRLQAGGDVAVQQRGGLGSSTGGLQLSPFPPPPSSSLLLSSCGGQGGNPPWGGGAVQGGMVGRLLVGAAPRV